MGKKKKQQINLERKITKVFLKNPNKEFNYKQISAALNVKDTKGRNEIIKSITKMHNKKNKSQVLKTLKNLNLIQRFFSYFLNSYFSE